ncbi:hypothetical protein ALC62_12675 [Cyphomyrmex costatus]|uniref:Uncharacterized protein n=1 Tax=Cyphomyrmex costatus TaxID=456900 RepID=A0A195C937_9HYME|nr:hypothetical protein ALC62_12675 [Cyphomyrmex costatus]
MEQQKKTCNLVIIFVLTIVSIHHVTSMNQNLNTIINNINSTDGDKVTNHVWLQPLNTTTIYQDSTIYLPTSTSVEAKEILVSSETKNVLNQYTLPFYQRKEHTRKNDDPEEPSDYSISYSEHEETGDVPTKPKYVAPGIWAKPPPEKNITLDFVPTKLHAQVRGSHTVKRLPLQQAVESAETDEEKLNAHRLREVVTNTKVNTVYTEEGYEDSAYDHAGHIRDADFHEGFARKLHNRKKSEKNSLSGKKKKEENKNLMPDEFKEYEEDYQDHLQESRKLEEANDEDNLIGYDRNSWEKSEIDPKFIAKNNIQKLEEDVEKDAEEAEMSSKIYQNTQESKLHHDVKIDSSELDNEDNIDDNVKHENKSIKTNKKKSKLRNGKDNNVSKTMKQLRKLEQEKENHETTVLPLEEASLTNVESSAIPHGFMKNSLNSQMYSIDQTTLRYIPSFTTASFQQVDEPTTINYSQLFWDYFKAKQDPSIIESSTLVPNSTTMNLQEEARTPIAVATIDGHGPYLLVTKEETMTSPSTFFEDEFPHSSRRRDLFSDHVEFDQPSVQTHGRHLLQQKDDVDYVNNVITTSTVETFTSMQPLPSLSPESVEYSSSTTFFDTTVSSSTPPVMTLNFTQEAIARIADYHENPFLSPVLDNSNIAVTRKLKYKVLARAKPSHEKKLIKSVTQSSNQQVPTSSFVKSVSQSSHQQVPMSSKEGNEYKMILDQLNAKYNKMLSYVKNNQEAPSLPKDKKVVFRKNLTLTRPPIQGVAYSIFLTDHPSTANHSTVFIESESSRETNWKKLQNQHRSRPIKLPFRSDPFDHVQPVRSIYRKNLLPTTKLLPPPPLPFTNAYANYRSNNQNDNHHFYSSSKPQQRDNVFKYFPLNPEATWRTRSRRKRSNEGEFRDGADVNVKAVANNSVTNDYKSSQQDKRSFDRVIDRLKRKSSRKAIHAPIAIPDAMKLTFFARLRGDESGTSSNKNNTVTQPILIQSAKRNKQIKNTSDTDVTELAKKGTGVGNKIYLTSNLKNKADEKDYEQLLNESPKISGDIIDKEIATRFNENSNETSLKKNKKIEIEVPNFPYVEEFAEDDLVKSFKITTEAAIDLKKYPFYNNENVPSASALKYAVDPKTVPRKTSRGMEFYDSRNAYKQCDEIEPNLDKVLPEKEEPDPKRGQQEDLSRLRGLGDKLDCFKAKYFDENPLDNPLFAEKLIDEPTPPTELNPTKFSSKIMILPEQNDEYVVPQLSKKPERSGRQWRNRIHPYETLESIRVNYKHDPQTGRGRNAYFHTVRGMRPPSNTMRRVKNRKPRPKISTTTPSSALYQTVSYQNQVYEDVMGNIRNLKNAYQVYEMTTLPPSTQILETAGSENMLKVAKNTSKSSKEKSTLKPDVSDVTDVTNNTKSLEIKGLVPPPKYFVQQQSYRKYRPLVKGRTSLIRTTTLPRIPFITHRTIKISKRSTINDTSSTAKNSSESTIIENKKTTLKAKNVSKSVINKNKNATVNESIEVDPAGNKTSVKLIEEAMNKLNATSEPLDLEIEESRPISTLDQSLFTTLKIDDKKKRRNFTNSDLKYEPRKTVYTIRDRIRYSKPKWDMRRFGKFTSSKTVDEDDRRKEPRYNHVERKKKPFSDQQNNYTIINATESTSRIESATSLIKDRESSTTEAYYAEESAMQQKIYRKKDEYPESKKVKNIYTESEESFFGEDEKESTTNTYQVRENIDEDVSTTNPQSSKEVLDLREYLKSDPPGYAETFPEEATTPLNKYNANTNHKSEDSGEKQEEETDYPGNVANPWDNESSEKIEEQVETPMKLFEEDDDSEESSSKEEEGSNKDQTFFTYTKRPLIKNDKDDELPEKTTYEHFPFSRYKSKIKKEREENDPEEESEEESEDYVFPWHADKKIKGKEYKWLHNADRYEYPWERRDRLARERRLARARFFDDEDEEESMRFERPIYSWQKPIYPWEKYNVPSKSRNMNTRRDVSRRYIDDNEESNTENIPFMKYSSRYSSSGAPSNFSSAREISRSIKKFLEEDDESEKKTSKEIENYSPLFARKLSSPSDRGISRGRLVPEDITQPPKRKNAKRKLSQIGKNVSNNSRFDSRKLRSEDVINEEEEEPVEYLKLNRSNLDEVESSIEITNSQPSKLSNGTKEVLSATGQHKKRRRRILKNNSTISLDNASSESVTKSIKKRRRKPVASTTTTAPPSASINFGTKKSAFTPIQRKYSKKNKANRSDFSKKMVAVKTIAMPETIKTDNFQVETSTPKTRTIEHLSRISKEKIITKTTYPETENKFDSMKTNVTSAQNKPVKFRIKSKRKKNDNKQNGNNEDSDTRRKLIKQEDKKEDYKVKFVNQDKTKKSLILDKSQEKNKSNALKRFGMKKEEVKKINDFGTYNGIVNDENDNDDFGIASEIYPIHNLMQNIIPNRKQNRANEKTKSIWNSIENWKARSNGKEEKVDEEQKQKPLLQAKFIKDPEHRLYYYVEQLKIFSNICILKSSNCDFSVCDFQIILVFGLVAFLNLSTAAPDSAGIVEMVNGLAYGGIPYGSVSGMLTKYPGYGQVNAQARQFDIPSNTQRPVIITPNFRATRLMGISPQPVQIYNLPGVIAPGIVGRISQIGPDILANFAKNVASVLSPVILRDVQSRNNRSSFQSTLSEFANLNDNDLNSHSILDNIVDKTSNAATYYGPRSHPYNGLYEDSPEELERSETNERFDGSLRDGSYLRQKQSNVYRPYDFSTNNDNLAATSKSSDNIDSSIGSIQESSTNLYPSYHGGGFPKAAFPHGPFLDKPYGGFYGGFGPYGHHHHHHHHHPYGDGSSEEAGTEENARLENRTSYGGYGSPYGGFDHHHPYSPFPYDGYGHHDFYGPYQRNGNDSSRNRHHGHHGYGPYGGPDFYGPGGYGYNHGGYGYGNNNGNNNRNNNNNNNNRQTEEPTENGDQNNSTKNGYSPPYGPPWVKPLLGIFHPHDFPLLPHDHFHGLFKGGPVVGVGHVGYPIYADPYLVGFPFHHPYGPFIHGKKYLPPKGKPVDSGESAETTEAPAELMENEAPERITALNDEEIAPAPSSNQYKTAGRKELKQIKLVNFEIRRV